MPGDTDDVDGDGADTDDDDDDNTDDDGGDDEMMMMTIPFSLIFSHGCPVRMESPSTQ